jgi:uridine kinase
MVRARIVRECGDQEDRDRCTFAPQATPRWRSVSLNGAKRILDAARTTTPTGARRRDDMTEHRAEVIDTLTQLVLGDSSRKANAVLRVAVTGITASGKTTPTNELVTRIVDSGKQCVRVPVDGFHNPRSIRYRRGRESAEGYYRDAYDYDQLIQRALIPLGSPEDRSYVAQVFDLDADTPVEAHPVRLEPGSIAIFDASFLLRQELRDHFDYRILVQTSFEDAMARGVRRDAATLGGSAEAERGRGDSMIDRRGLFAAFASPGNLVR